MKALGMAAYPAKISMAAASKISENQWRNRSNHLATLNNLSASPRCLIKAKIAAKNLINILAGGIKWWRQAAAWRRNHHNSNAAA